MITAKPNSTGTYLAFSHGINVTAVLISIMMYACVSKCSKKGSQNIVSEGDTGEGDTGEGD